MATELAQDEIVRYAERRVYRRTPEGLVFVRNATADDVFAYARRMVREHSQ